MHIAGRASKDLFEIQSFCKSKGIALVEDNAQGFLSKIDDKPLGSIGAYSALSFQTTKVVAGGEGGCIVANDPNTLTDLKALTFYGRNRQQKLL